MTKFKIISWILKIFISFYILGSITVAYSIYRLLSDAPDTIISKDNKEILNSFENISHNIFWIVISFALLAVADIIKKGENIKLENDLTI